MSDDLPISDFADQLHDDLLVKRLTDSDNTGFSNDLEKGASVDDVPKTASGGFFYSLVTKKCGKAYAIYSQRRFLNRMNLLSISHIPDCSVYGSFFAANLHAWDKTRSFSF